MYKVLIQHQLSLSISHISQRNQRRCMYRLIKQNYQQNNIKPYSKRAGHFLLPIIIRRNTDKNGEREEKGGEYVKGHQTRPATKIMNNFIQPMVSRKCGPKHQSRQPSHNLPIVPVYMRYGQIISQGRNKAGISNLY